MRRLLWICLAWVVACAHEGAPPPGNPTAPPDYAKLRAQCDGGQADGCRRLAAAIVTKQPGAPTDMAVARSLYTRACDELNDADGCVALAGAYRRGAFSDAGKDVGRAGMYAERACNLAPDTACILFAEMVLVGEGVPADIERARAMLDRGCDKNQLVSCAAMHALLRAGRLETRNGRGASFYLDKFCASGFADLCSGCATGEKASGEAAATAVPLNVLRAQLVAGTMEIHLPEPVLEGAVSRGVTRLRAIAKICITDTGDVACVQFLKKTGYDLADRTILSAVSTWRFRPYRRDDKPIPVCSPYLWNYEISR